MTRKFTILALCLLLTSVVGGAIAQDDDDGPTCAEQLDAVQTAIDNEDYEIALDLVTEAETLCADEATAYITASRLRGQIDAALENIRLEAIEPGWLNLGDYELFMACFGEGSPTVILEHGLGDGWEIWNTVQPALAEVTRVCAYSRLHPSSALVGESGRTTQDQVDDLVAMLTMAEIEGPYILVGHSIAGLNLLLFADQYPDDVVGLVMVDTSHPDQLERLNAVDPERFPIPDVPSFNIERLNIVDSFAQVAAVGDLGELPLVVLTQDSDDAESDPVAAVWLALQQDHASRSTNSQHIVVAGAGHYVQTSHPEIVIEAVLWILDSADPAVQVGATAAEAR